MLTTTLAIVLWSQPPYSFTPANYTITLSQIFGTGDDEQEVVDKVPVTTTGDSMEFAGLKRSSTYVVTVTASFDDFGVPLTISTRTRFITLSFGTFSPLSIWQNLSITNTLGIGTHYREVSLLPR